MRYGWFSGRHPTPPNHSTQPIGLGLRLHAFGFAICLSNASIDPDPINSLSPRATTSSWHRCQIG